MIRASILLLPEHMGRDWKKNLDRAITTMFQDKCTQEHGYILEIHRVARILDQQVTRLDGNIRFNLDIDVTVMKPQIGDVLEATIEMIFPHGVFCCHRMLRMMLPLSRCPGFHVRQDFSTISLLHPASHLCLRKGDSILVSIEDVRFENDLFSCIVAMASKDVDDNKKERGDWEDDERAGQVVLHAGVSESSGAVLGRID